MGFLSLSFFGALVPAFLLFQLLPRRQRPAFLLLCSYLFVLSWSVTAAAVLLLLTTAAYLSGQKLAASTTDQQKRLWLGTGLAALLGALFIFKYAQPIVDGIDGLFQSGPAAHPTLSIIAPIGLSYYVFKLVSYLVDIYWEKIPAEASFLKLALYSAWFPQIPSGPIQRADDFLPQLDSPNTASLTFHPELINSGLRLILFGAFEKLVVADRLGPIVDAAFDRPSAPASAALLGTWCFALQLYADFAAASEIAVGLGRLFGISAPPNFDAPFMAGNIQDFWRRWHMTLTSWMSDYVFTPLRMQLRNLGTAGLVIAILVNMMAVALWHNASWTFVLFGLINGVYIVISALTLKRRNRFYKARPTLGRLRALTAPLLVFHLMALAFVFVRIKSVPRALGVLQSGFHGTLHLALHPMAFASEINSFLRLSGVGRFAAGIAFLGVLGMSAGHYLQRRPALLSRFFASPLPLRWTLYYAISFGTLFLGQLNQRSFIYTAY